MKYTIQLHQETLPDMKNIWVGIVDQNDVSSFWDTEQEALDMTIDALLGVLSVESEMIDVKSSHTWKTEFISGKNEFTLTLPTYATDLPMNRSHKAHGEARMVA